MKIEKIKKLKSGKYKIELDNNDKIITYDDVILNNNLLFNKEIDNEIINKLNIDTKNYDIYNKVIKYISTKMRSQKEIYKYLEKLNIPNEEQEEIVSKLKNIKLINDENYVKAFISDKINLSNYGPYKIKRELLDFDIDESYIDSELSIYDMLVFKNKIKKILLKKIKANKNSPYIFYNKMFQYFYDLGYPKDMIEQVLNENKVDNNIEIIKNEYKKIIMKLQKKYDGDELIYNVKCKLYQKGFSTEQINEVLKNE